MRLRTLLAGATALASLTGLGQAAPLHGWYMGIEAGVNWIDTIDQVQEFPSHATLKETVSFDPGWGVIGTVGRMVGENWRVEAEFGYRENKVDILDAPAFRIHQPIDGTASEFTLMANVVYDIMLSDSVALNLGAGLGADRAHTTSQTAHFDDTAWSMAYQGIAGVSYDLGEGRELFANFRYLVVDGPDYFDASFASAGTLHQDNIHKELLTIGIRLGD